MIFPYNNITLNNDEVIELYAYVLQKNNMYDLFEITKIQSVICTDKLISGIKYVAFFYYTYTKMNINTEHKLLISDDDINGFISKLERDVKINTILNDTKV